MKVNIDGLLVSFGDTISDTLAALRCDVSIADMRGACVRDEVASIRTPHGWHVNESSLRAWKKARKAARDI